LELVLDLVRHDWVMQVIQQSVATFLAGGYHVALNGMTVGWCAQVVLTLVTVKGLGLLARDVCRALDQRHRSAVDTAGSTPTNGTMGPGRICATCSPTDEA
jgi:hypothetical protein